MLSNQIDKLFFPTDDRILIIDKGEGFVFHLALASAK